MSPETRTELVRLSNKLSADLHNFVGEQNDELTRKRITDVLRRHLAFVEQIVPISFDLNLVGVDSVNRSGIYPWQHRTDEIIPNDYTRNLFKEIEGSMLP